MLRYPPPPPLLLGGLNLDQWEIWGSINLYLISPARPWNPILISPRNKRRRLRHLFQFIPIYFISTHTEWQNHAKRGREGLITSSS